MQRSLVTLAGLAFVILTIAVFHQSTRIATLETELKSGRGGQIRAALPAPQPVIPRADLSDLEKTTISLFSERSQSVAHITTLQQVRTNPFRMDATEVPRGSGSGFVWDTQGHIVTNFHVIQGADIARVTLSDHSVWEARLVGGSERNDIAVLSIDRPEAELRPIVLGTSHDLAVGQLAFAIGSPFGLDYTLSTGVISGLGREIQGLAGVPIQGVIQTDAAINPGNSGGPLLDSAGRLIGMNTMIVSPSGGSSGVGFAVPVDTIRRVVPDLIKYGREVRPSIGVNLADDALTHRFGLAGALVLGVLPGTPAEKVGLQPTQRDALGRIALGDLIVGVDETPIEKNADLFLALEKHKAGDKVKLTVVRGGSARVELVTELVNNVDTAP